VNAAEIHEIVENANILRYRAVFDGEVCVGIVALKLIPQAPPEIVVATVAGQRRKGYATAAVEAILRYTFEETNVPTVYAKCEIGAHSNGVVAKTGFDFVVEENGERFYRLHRNDWVDAHPSPAPPPAEIVASVANAKVNPAAALQPKSIPNPASGQSKGNSLRTWLLNGFSPVEARTKSEARTLFKKEGPIPPGAKIVEKPM
jgi:hypothetical protein